MSGFLDAFAALAQRSGGNVFCVGEMRGDCVPQLKTLKVNNPCQDVYSVAKAFTVTAVGLLVDRGLLSVQETITDVLKDQLPADCAPVWYSTTLDMLLRHQVALPEGFLDIDGWDANEFGEDYLAYTLQYPIPADMAPRYCYTDAAFYLLSRAVEARAGVPLDTFLWKELFFPLDCREAAWSRCPQGHAMGATGLYIRVEDMLKLGRLYLDGGVWQGRRILSQQWVETVRSRGYELNPVGVGDAFGKGGMRGQMLIIIPQQDRVAAWQSCEDTCSADYVRFAAQYRDEAPTEDLH
ncbi:MAG: beta-lactamase family protein [Oscillospiraceae bacterium]|nr:beta-lactamase family protein [Oscillospiraceae bacterium]